MGAQTPEPQDTLEENLQEKSHPEGATQGAGPLLGPHSHPWLTNQGQEEEQPHPGPVETTKQLQLQQMPQVLGGAHGLPTSPGPSATATLTLDDSDNGKLAPAAAAPAWPRTSLGANYNPEPGDGNNVTPLPALHIGPAGTTRTPSNVDPREEPNAKDDGFCCTLAERPSGYC